MFFNKGEKEFKKMLKASHHADLHLIKYCIEHDIPPYQLPIIHAIMCRRSIEIMKLAGKMIDEQKGIDAILQQVKHLIVDEDAITVELRDADGKVTDFFKGKNKNESTVDAKAEVDALLKDIQEKRKQEGK